MKAIGFTADELFDFAVGHPEGFTRSDACDEYSCSSRDFDSVARDLRRVLGDDDNIFLVCTTQGRGEWRYQLVGNLDGAREWGAWNTTPRPGSRHNSGFTGRS